MWWAQWLAESLRYVGENRSGRFYGVMNYGNFYSDDTGFRSVILLFLLL